MSSDKVKKDNSVRSASTRRRDLSTVRVVHEDGELVLVVPRKTGTRIPVGRPREHVPESQAPTPVVAEAPAEQDEMEDAAAAADSSAVTSAAEKASAGEP